jgi:hypothetical protein
MYKLDSQGRMILYAVVPPPDCLIATSLNLLTDCPLYLAENHRFTTVSREHFDLAVGLT